MIISRNGIKHYLSNDISEVICAELPEVKEGQTAQEYSDSLDTDAIAEKIIEKIYEHIEHHTENLAKLITD
jgi:hypothetical protein